MQPEILKQLALDSEKKKGGKLVPSEASYIKRAIYNQCVDCFPDENPRLCEEENCLLFQRWMRSKRKRKKLSDLKAIHQYCIWCMNDQPYLVKDCPSLNCSLYLYRMGHNPGLKGKKVPWLKGRGLI